MKCENATPVVRQRRKSQGLINDNFFYFCDIYLFDCGRFASQQESFKESGNFPGERAPLFTRIIDAGAGRDLRDSCNDRRSQPLSTAMVLADMVGFNIDAFNLVIVRLRFCICVYHRFDRWGADKSP